MDQSDGMRHFAQNASTAQWREAMRHLVEHIEQAYSITRRDLYSLLLGRDDAAPSKGRQILAQINALSEAFGRPQADIEHDLAAIAAEDDRRFAPVPNSTLLRDRISGEYVTQEGAFLLRLEALRAQWGSADEPIEVPDHLPQWNTTPAPGERI